MLSVTEYHNSSTRPIFIVGYMHSGTTLLMSILSNHPEIFGSKGETKFFELLDMIKATYQQLENDAVLDDYLAFILNVIVAGFDLRNRSSRSAQHPPTEIWETLRVQARQSRDYIMVFKQVFETLCEYHNKTRWLEKTPTHIFHAQAIADAIPDVQFVEIVRDPRDVVTSKRRRRQTVWTERYRPEDRPFKNLEKAYDPLWDAMSWKSAVQAGRQIEANYPLSHYRLRYEDLVSEPREQIMKLCEYLDLEYSDNMLQVENRNPAEPSDRKKGVSKHAVGRWRNSLPKRELAVVQVVTSPEIKYLGYGIGSTTWIDRLGSFLIILKSLFEFGHRLYRRWRMGGFIFLRQVLKNYFRRLRVITRAK